MGEKDIIVVGAGLAGLSCGLELVEKGHRVRVFEARNVVGGRTSSWIEDGMKVESGLHRFLGFYSALPKLIKKAGLKLDDVIVWEDQIEIRLPNNINAALDASPIRRPIRTLKSALGNNHFLSIKDKISFIRFVLKGLYDYSKNPRLLDQKTVLEYATKLHTTQATIDRLLLPFTEGVFFLPPQKYSAYNLLGLLAPYWPAWYRFGVGAFKGGMTEVMAEPIAEAIRKRGGEVKTQMPIEKLWIEEGKVTGVVLVGGEPVKANHVVLATSIVPAQRLVQPLKHQALEPFLRLPSMPTVTIQFELKEPALPIDRTTFGPQTILSSFSEQSRTTFRHAKGRLSVILAKPELFLHKEPKDTLEAVIADARTIGIELKDKIIDYRIVKHPHDFYSFAPGHEELRPTQATPIPGLTLAGDYTKQKYLSTMEGAVVSGQKAAEAVLDQL